MIIAVGTSQPLAALLQIILLAWVQFDGDPSPPSANQDDRLF